MIVEVRTYKIKPGLRDDFIRFFETRSVPALRSHGMKVLGPLKDAFYEGELWKKELESIAMPMIESYDVDLTETSPGCVTFDPAGTGQ